LIEEHRNIHKKDKELTDLEILCKYDNNGVIECPVYGCEFDRKIQGFEIFPTEEDYISFLDGTRVLSKKEERRRTIQQVTTYKKPSPNSIPKEKETETETEKKSEIKGQDLTSSVTKKRKDSNENTSNFYGQSKKRATSKEYSKVKPESSTIRKLREVKDK
jgi:hypothetical protein